MKINFREILDKDTLLEDLVMITSPQFKESIEDKNSKYQKTGYLDIELKINNIDINPLEFFNELEKLVREKDNKFDKWVKEYLSKNSRAAKDSKIKKKLDMIFNELQNINSQLKED